MHTCTSACVPACLRGNRGLEFTKSATKYVRGSRSMSEGADSVAQTCGDLLEHSTDKGEHDGERNATATTAMQQQPPPLPPTPPPPPPPPPPPSAMTYTGRRPRFGTGSVPSSPYVWVDGRQLRSALAWTKKRPLRRVSFPTNDNHLVTSYLEPANPWQHGELSPICDTLSLFYT